TEEFVENPKLLEEIIFYEDKEKFQKQISKLQNEENNIRHLEFEYRVVTNKGEIRCIHHICRKIFNEEGKYLGLRVSNRDITENKKAIDTISKLSTVIEQSPLAIVITDRNGIIEYANKMTREVTGYDVKELIGKKTSIFKSDETDKKKYAELWHTILEGNIWEGQILNRRKNGELYWEKLILSPILNENNKIINIVAIKEDINKRILLQKELYKYKENLEELVEKRTLQLKQSEKKFKALAENSEDIIVRFNIELNVTYVNKAIESLTGIKKDEWIGKSIVDLKYSKNKLLLWQKTLREVLQNKKVRRLEYDLGNGKWIDWIIIPELMDNGNINSLLVTGRDITSIKEYEINLIDALRREQELNELKSRFISIASHEFRTPLTAILSSSQMLQRFSVKWDNSKLQEHYNRIFESVNNLTELIDEILLIGKAEEGNIELNSCNIEIKEIIEQIIDKLKVSLKSGQIISTEKVNVFNVFTDKKIVEKIITNLLSNAIKYSGEGTKIIIETRKLKNSYVIIVKDEGIGIDEKILDFIFNPFYRADNVMHIHGTGLGLNIVKRFVTLLGGNVSVKSKLNKG
ncbi:MAG: PAS domain S-box protein, partial [Candidatus Nanoarchaeia archaeon]